MPVSLTFFLALVLAAGLFFGFFAFVTGAIGFQQKRSRPKMGVTSGKSKGQLGVWVTWSDTVFKVEFYRVLVSFYAPDQKLKEGRFTVTFDPVAKKSFFVPFELPAEFINVLENDQKAIFSIQVRTTEELMVETMYPTKKLKKIYEGTLSVPKGVAEMEVAKADTPFVTTLDFEELTVNKARVGKLVAAATAKAKKAAEAAAAKEAAAKAAKEEEASGGGESAKAETAPAAKTS